MICIWHFEWMTCTSQCFKDNKKASNFFFNCGLFFLILFKLLRKIAIRQIYVIFTLLDQNYTNTYITNKQIWHACSGNSQHYWPEVLEMKSSPAPRNNSFDCSLNRHEITVILTYIHAHNHKSTDDNVSITYH